MTRDFRDFAAVLAAALLFVPCAAGAADAAGRPATADERALDKLEQDWIAAENRHDAAALRAILDDHFISTFAGGAPRDKEAFIKAVTAGPPDPTVTQTLSHRKVVVTGRTAVITEIDTIRRIKDAKPSVQTYRFTVTYIKRGGRWLALAEHGTWATP